MNRVKLSKQLLKIDKIDTLFLSVLSFDEWENNLVDLRIQPPSKELIVVWNEVLKISKNIEQDLNLFTMFCGIHLEHVEWTKREQIGWKFTKKLM